MQDILPIIAQPDSGKKKQLPKRRFGDVTVSKRNAAGTAVGDGNLER
jgi:hypothetical protein